MLEAAQQTVPLGVELQQMLGWQVNAVQRSARLPRTARTGGTARAAQPEREVRSPGPGTEPGWRSGI